ncbi:MAG: hypothetical protein KAU62_09215 [Candidatus Heimdallarchaeota archaeon]|nr:hypothetical protein [Candidatus Heimdallarchaeota archaeon]MCK4611319.1 hypothetical protein [Candidatus Heimdallarchaeota archaeon]
MSEKPLKERFPKLKGFETFEEKSKKFLKKIGESFESYISDVFDTMLSVNKVKRFLLLLVMLSIFFTS